MESSQPALFHDRIEDAIDEVIRHCGGRKAFACELWPTDKSPRDAHNLLDACLNPERRERLTPSQLMFIARRGREAGCHALINYITGESGYTQPAPIEPADERAELQKQYIEAAKAMSRIAERIERGLGPRLAA